MHIPQNIEVPAYVVASWTNPIHTHGTFRAYQLLRSEKWLRVHDSWVGLTKSLCESGRERLTRFLGVARLLQ